MKLPFRTKSLGTKVSEGEYARLEALASGRGQTISELIRSVLLEEIAAPNGHGHIAAEQTLLAEVVGLRTILLNLFFKLANGERITAEEMQRLIERADADKLKKAQERKLSARLSPEGNDSSTSLLCANSQTQIPVIP